MVAFAVPGRCRRASLAFNQSLNPRRVFSMFRREFFRIMLIAIAMALTVIGAWLLLHRPRFVEATPVSPRVASAVDAVLASRREETIIDGDVPFGKDDEINILLLGIDSRKEGNEKHCDAIHMITVNTADWTTTTTSVPRGTYAYIPPGTYDEDDYYLANACAFAGIDYGIEQIERIVGVKHDFLVTVGFSQAYGVLRLLRMPTVESLQWLRHRRSYAIGDPQRSHNQAVFTKDLAVRFLDDGLSLPMLYLLYRFVDTDMDFAAVRALHDGLVASGIASRPEDIALMMKPEFDTVDMHFDVDDPDAQLALLLDRIRGATSKEDLSDRSIEDVQQELIAYLERVIDAGEDYVLMSTEQLWRQVVDDGERERLHFAFVDAYAGELLATDRDAAIQLVADYILEKQTLGLLSWEQRGRELLDQMLQ